MIQKYTVTSFMLAVMFTTIKDTNALMPSIDHSGDVC